MSIVHKSLMFLTLALTLSGTPRPLPPAPDTSGGMCAPAPPARRLQPWEEGCSEAPPAP
jgi:hypothetical protein